MKRLNKLDLGGKIYLVAPSCGSATEPYYTRTVEAIKNFKKEGFKVIEGPNIFLSEGHVRSNSARKCAKEINDAFFSDADAIISVGGGETMCEILPFIDFKKIKKGPEKIFMGFSDNTNLTYTLTTMCEMETIYGPCASQFWDYPFSGSTKYALDLMMQKTDFVKGFEGWIRYPNHELSREDPFHKDEWDSKKILKVRNTKNFDVNGIMLGGCLDCLINLCGTKFDHTKEFIEKYKDEGFIWFLEACDLNPMCIERALFQLRESGWFKYVKGFVFGRPLCFGQKYAGVNHVKAIKVALKGINVPYVLDADLGHFNPSMPIICGRKANVSVKDENILIKYE